MGKPDPILRETFRVGGLPYSAFLFPHQIAWCPQKKGGEDMSEWINVKLKDVLNVEVIYTKYQGAKSRCCLPVPGRLKSKSTVPASSQFLLIHYAQAKKDSDKWKEIELQLDHDDCSLLNKWSNTIKAALDEFEQRPKNLLFIINPFGGKRKAVSIFEQHVKPILLLSRIKWTVIHTQRRSHATEILASMSDESLKEYDAVVAVGGDGTICEVVTGLLTRECSTSSDIDETDLKPALLPVAVIGAGSTNALAFTINGTDDPRTGMIYIALGGSLPLDVGAVHNHSGIARFIVGQMSYGYLADTMVHSETLRWMGPKRYDYAGFRKFVSHAVYEGSIEMKIANDDNRKIPSQCLGGKGCEECNEVSKRNKPNGEWKRVEGQFIGVSGANISCRCALSPAGMAPFAHLSDGHMELILIRKASRLSHLRYLLRTTRDSRRAFALPFVERYRVDEFVFTPVQCCNNNSKGPQPNGDGPNAISPCECDTKHQEKTHSVWNCDGELLYQPSVRVTVHRNLIRIMTRSLGSSLGTPISQSYEPDEISLSHTVSTTLITRSSSIDTNEIDPSIISLEDCSLNTIRF